MQTNVRFLLTAPPDRCQAVLHFGLPVVHVAYRVGGGLRLFQTSISVSVRGGLMVIDNIGFDGRGEAGPFHQEVLRECMAREYDGILCGLEDHLLQVLTQAAHTPGELAKKQGWSLYVTGAYAPFSDSATALIPPALSGGSLQQRLQEAMECLGAARVALTAKRVAEDLFLPSPIDQGTPLTREGLRQRLEGQAPPVFFSSELCTHHPTYMPWQNEAHFVLFDGAGSIRKKLQVTRNLDIPSAVLAYPQVDDLLPELLK